MKLDKEKLKRKLLCEFTDCQEPGWDSYTALPVSKEEYDRFLGLIDLLPPDIEHPRLSPLYDGTFEIEWETPEDSVLIFWDDTEWVAMFWKKRVLIPLIRFKKDIPDEVSIFIKELYHE